jgi:uncharacterized protein YdhG (YjbR/CyaY superfamily)
MENLRTNIRATAPEAVEKISYGIPTFTLNDTYLIYFAGWKNHISIYPIPAGNEAFNKEVARYMAGKGTLQFSYDKPLPYDLITKIVELRVAEVEKRTDKKKY